MHTFERRISDEAAHRLLDTQSASATSIPQRRPEAVDEKRMKKK
jgi:hypothetical protein